MRDRLIELTKASLIRHIDKTCKLAENITDDLLANGVIVPPCKVGDTVYVPWHWGGQQGIATVEIEEIKFYDTQMHYMFFIDMESDEKSFDQSYGGWKLDESIGKTVFLTREEAVKALAERSAKCQEEQK